MMFGVRILARKNVRLLRVTTFHAGTSGGGRSVDVLVDGGVVLVIDDDTVVVSDDRHGHGGADRRQRLVRGRGVMVVVVATGAHEHGRGRRVPAATGLVRKLHPVALVRTGAAGGRAERPRARLVVRVEKLWIADVLLDRVHVGGRHHVQVRRLVVARAVAAAATDWAVDQRLRFLHQKCKTVDHYCTII